MTTAKKKQKVRIASQGSTMPLGIEKSFTVSCYDYMLMLMLMPTEYF
jgi:hypothetical protein